MTCRRFVARSCIALVALEAMRCSSPSPIAGAGPGGTDYPNTRTVAGVLVDTTGMPVDSARVLLLKSGADSSSGLATFEAETSFTNTSGAYAFDGVDPGEYHLEGYDALEGLVGYETGLAKDEQTALIVDTLALGKAGALSGSMVVRGDVVVVVAIAGTYYRASPDSLGVFHFPVLPRGAYDLRILVVDTSGQTDAVDTTIAGTNVADSSSLAETVELPALYSWPHVKRLLLNTTRTGAGVDGDVYGFPVLIRLDGDVFDFSTAAPNGANVRFARSDGSPLSYQVESWDSQNKSAAVWVKVDTLHGDSLQPLYMYWGRGNQADLSDGTMVFDSSRGFRGVWHLDGGQDGTGATAAYRDATAFGAHGTDQVSAAGKAGIIGDGQEFDGVDDYIDVPFSVEPDGPITVSAWFRADVVPTGTDHGYRLFSTYNDNSGQAYGFQFRTHQNDLMFTAGNGDSTRSAGSWDILTVQWSHIAAVYEPGTGAVTMYIDGEPVTMGAAATRPSIVYQGTTTYISHPTRLVVDGTLDEVRVSTAARSADWMRLCYENQKVRQTLVEF